MTLPMGALVREIVNCIHSMNLKNIVLILDACSSKNKFENSATFVRFESSSLVLKLHKRFTSLHHFFGPTFSKL